MSETGKIIVAAVLGIVSVGIIGSIFKFIIINYFKKIGENEKRIEGNEKDIIKIHGTLENMKKEHDRNHG